MKGTAMFQYPAKSLFACRVLLLALVCLGALPISAVAQSVRDTVLEVTAAASPAVPHVTLNWITPGGVTVTAQQLWKRAKGSASWGTAIPLAAGDTSYPDTTALPGVAYEYSLRRTRSGTPTTVYGAIVAGYNLPLVESRGNVCLLVDATMSIPLAPELAQLTSDLMADGWTVFRHDVPRAVVSASSANTADWPTRIATTSNTGSAADLADPDGDGLLNFFECAFGQSPLAPSPLAHTVPGHTTVSNSRYLTLTFIRDTTLTGVVLQAESASTLLGSWTTFDPLSPANQLSVQSNTPAPGLETITIRDVQAIPPGEARFMRLRVTRS